MSQIRFVPSLLPCPSTCCSQMGSGNFLSNGKALSATMRHWEKTYCFCWTLWKRSLLHKNLTHFQLCSIRVVTPKTLGATKNRKTCSAPLKKLRYPGKDQVPWRHHREWPVSVKARMEAAHIWAEMEMKSKCATSTDREDLQVNWLTRQLSKAPAEPGWPTYLMLSMGVIAWTPETQTEYVSKKV